MAYISYSQLQKNSKMSKEELKSYMIKKREDDEQPITGIFENKQRPGHDLKFSFKMWPDSPKYQFHLIDGEQDTIPKGVMNWINSRAIPQYEYITTNNPNVGAVQSGFTSTPDGRTANQPYRIAKMVPKYKFSPTSYYPGMFEDSALKVQPDLVVVEANPGFAVQEAQKSIMKK